MIRRWIVHGHVQGVGYRWFVTRQAERMGLGGYARNLGDGSVEVAASGTSDQLERLEEALRRGPILSQVTSVQNIEVPHELKLANPFEAQ